MNSSIISYLPPQAIPRSKKNRKWMEDCVRFADNNTVLSSSLVRRTIAHKKINYDLFHGKLDMEDLERMANPDGIDYNMKSKPIQHYPIMNRYINLLLGEEASSQFDYKVIVTNPDTISDIAEKRKTELINRLQSLIEDKSLSDEEYQNEVQKLQDYYNYRYQDFREIRANRLIQHYSKEQNFNGKFNDGFADVLIVHEEIYQCYIESGEPKLSRLDPMSVHVYGSGRSNNIEDADMVVIEDYWSLGKITDNYYNQLTAKDIKQLESKTFGHDGSDGYQDPRNYFKFGNWVDNFAGDDNGAWVSFNDGVGFNKMPYDIMGNIRVLQVYWKSKRRILEVKKYDEITGKPYTEFHTEDYICNEELGEESKSYYVNEAWHGVMIGAGDNAIFVDMGPCKVQYNTMTNPSRCHFGIVGTIYNINNSQPYSMVDMIKPFSYMYDVTYDRMNKLVARNLGKVIQLNKSILPKGWDIDTYIHYLKNAGLSVIDPMKEGNEGAAKGKLAGMFNTAPVIDLELSQSIGQMIQLLEFTDNNIAKITGLTPQRMGEIQNRETVGGVERATKQSSYSTLWWFAKHEDTKKRVITCFIETAKIALRGKNKKFEHILPDHSIELINIDGDVFAESDYGLVVDNGYNTQVLEQSIQQMAQASMQNGQMLMSSYFKILQNISLQEKIRILENDEQRSMERQQQAQQQQQQQLEMQLQQQAQTEQAKMQHEASMNTENNETKILIEQMKANASISEQDGDIEQSKLNEQIRQFNETIELQNRELEANIKKYEQDNETKLKIAKMKPSTK